MQTREVAPVIGVSHCSASHLKFIPDCQTSNSGGAIQIPSWQWNSRPALYPYRLAGCVMGVRSSCLRLSMFFVKLQKAYGRANQEVL